nr:WAP four-disulfide core domain protein 5 [Chlorocebus sabaeus]
MRIQSLLLLGALLAVGSQLPAVFGRKKGEKWGGCPADDGPCLLSVPDQCVEDSQCPLTRKCCYRACFRQCVPRVSVKPGSCPQDQLRCLSPVNHQCHKDSDCSGKKRCCHSACGRDCRDPARGRPSLLTPPPPNRVRNRNRRLQPPAASLPPPAAIDAAFSRGGLGKEEGRRGQRGRLQ